jgi:hypothetical protein
MVYIPHPTSRAASREVRRPHYPRLNPMHPNAGSINAPTWVTVW